MEMKLVLELRGRTYPVTVSAEETIFTVKLEDVTYIVDARGTEGRGALSLLLGTKSVEAWALSNGGGYKVSVLGETFEVEVEDALRARLRKLRGAAKGTEELITAPMPGTVVEVKARVGTTVADGEAVVIVEAMKMRNEFGPRHGGIVRKILVTPGQSVEQGQPLVLVARQPS